MSNAASASEAWPNLRPRIADLVASGRTDAIETLLSEHPDLRSQEQLLLDCIYAEFYFREERDQTPQPTEYLKRFPEYAGQLRALFEVHEALTPPAVDVPALRALYNYTIGLRAKPELPRSIDKLRPR